MGMLHAVYALTLALLPVLQVQCVPNEDVPLERPHSCYSIDTDRMLAALNGYREFHSSPPLQWSTELASSALKSANKLKVRLHCNLPLYYRDEIATNYLSSNIAAFTEDLAAQFWYEGHIDYNFEEGGPDNRNPNVMSFTQMVWKSSQTVGCGVVCCDGKQLILVCRFHPAGNIQGYFTQNVLEKFEALKGVTPGANTEL